MNLGTRIKTWRCKREWTTTQLAEAVGVSVSAVSHWESGKKHATTPTQKNLLAIAAALGITMEQFYGPLPRLTKAQAAKAAA